MLETPATDIHKTTVLAMVFREIVVYEGISESSELWLSGSVTSIFTAGIGSMGRAVRAAVRAHILPPIPWGME